MNLGKTEYLLEIGKKQNKIEKEMRKCKEFEYQGSIISEEGTTKRGTYNRTRQGKGAINTINYVLWWNTIRLKTKIILVLQNRLNLRKRVLAVFIRRNKKIHIEIRQSIQNNRIDTVIMVFSREDGQESIGIRTTIQTIKRKTGKVVDRRNLGIHDREKDWKSRQKWRLKSGMRLTTQEPRYNNNKIYFPFHNLVLIQISQLASRDI